MKSTSRSRLSAPSQDEIALRAHQLWCEQGCPAGHDVNNWLEAERQLASGEADRATDASDIGQKDLSPEKEDVPYSAFKKEAPLATKVAEQVATPGRPASRASATSLEVD